MFSAERFRSLLEARGLSQAELARRVGVSQPSINKLALGGAYGSKHIHVIARELGTTPAYLMGEIDDPDLGALPPPPPPPQSVTMQVLLPSEAALSRMFEGLLAPLDMEQPKHELARMLARRLPIGLSALRDLAPAPAVAEETDPDTSAPAPATARRASPRAPRT